MAAEHQHPLLLQCIANTHRGYTHPYIHLADFTEVLTSVFWAWLPVTDLFLPSEQRKTLPARPQIYMQLQEPVKLACVDGATAKNPLTSLLAHLFQFALSSIISNVLKKNSKKWLSVIKTATRNHTRYYHKDIWHLSGQRAFFFFCTVSRPTLLFCSNLNIRQFWGTADQSSLRTVGLSHLSRAASTTRASAQIGHC